jgi:uncharacterized protein (TIGR02611 family)
MAGPEQETPAAESRREERWLRRQLGPIRQARARFRRLPGGWIAWRIGVAIIGLIVVVAGIILLPLPGPGWLVVFAGIAIWATEFEWAERLLMWTKRQVREYSARLRAWWRRRNAHRDVGWRILDDRHSNGGTGD